VTIQQIPFSDGCRIRFGVLESDSKSHNAAE
jgi:hypothetical protein